MHIEDWPLDRIRPYPNNPRVLRNTAEKVAESIREFGWRQPIVVDEEGVVIIGHGRLAAAQLLKLPTAPVHIAAGLPPGKTWRGWLDDLIALWPPRYQRIIRSNIAQLMRLHNRKTAGRDIPDEVYDPVSGCSWKFLCETAMRGDLKGRRAQSMALKGDQTRRKTGQTLAAALSEVRP